MGVSMKRLFSYLAVILIISYLSVLSAADNTQLWLKAQEIAEANLNLVPGITNQQMTTIDDRSEKVYQKSNATIAHQLNDEGKIINVLLEKELGGENPDHPDNDIMLERILEKDLTPVREGLFFRNIGDNLRIKYTGERKTINGFNCVEFATEYITTGEDGQDITFEGSVWLDKISGVPVYLIFSMDKTPRFVRDITVERWFNFERDSNRWYEKEMLTTAEIRFLFKRMTNTTHITYADHWLYEPETLNND